LVPQKLILSVVSRVVVQLLQIIVGIVVARIVGPSVLGTVAFGLAYVSMFVFLADLGTSTAHIKLINEKENEGDSITTFSNIKYSLTIFFSLVVIVTIFVQKNFFNYKFESSIHEIVVLISLLSVIIGEFYKIPQSTFIAHVEQAKQDLPNLMTSILFQVLKLIVVLLGFKAISISVSQLVATILVAPFYFYLFKNYPRGKFDKRLAKKYLTISLPVIVIIAAQTIIYWSDKVMLQYLTNSAELGYYVTAFSFTNFIRLIENSAGTIFFPLFSKNLIDNEFDIINNRLSKYERFIFIYIFPLIALGAISSDLIISLLLGKAFLPAIPVLSVIIIAVFIPLINLPFGNILLGRDLFTLSAII
jgi:O-antigen/teichoic acid export membrane protein